MSETTEEAEIKERLLSTFADVASSLGYSSVHGKIIGALLIKDRAVSLQKLAQETGYSSSMVSLSLDLLEVLGIIQKVKKSGDRKLYIQLSGDLLECLKKAIVIKVQKNIDDCLQEFETGRQKLEKLEDSKETLRAVGILEEEIRRLEKYVDLLSDVELP